MSISRFQCVTIVAQQKSSAPDSHLEIQHERSFSILQLHGLEQATFCVTTEGKNESTIGLTPFYSALYFSPEVVQLISTYSPLAKDDYIFHIIAKKAEKQVFLWTHQAEKVISIIY